LGAGNAGASITGIYLSTDNVFDTGDTLLTTDAVVALDSLTGSWETVSISTSSIDPGSYYIFAVADYAKVIAEADETNNPSNAVALTVTAPSATAPEIAVSGHGNTIPDGDTTPSGTDHTDFGSVTQGGTAIQRTFTVRNDGDAALTTSGLTLPTGFSVVEGLSSSIAAGASDTFTIALDTTSAGTTSGEITFTNNDSDEDPFNFEVSGTVESTWLYSISDPLMTNEQGTLVVNGLVDGQLTFQTIGGLGPEWEFAGSGFLLGPGNSGFLLRNTDGVVAIGEVASGTAVFSTVAALGAEWEFAGNADFLGDGQSEFLIRNTGDVIGGALYLGEVVNGTAVFTGIGGIGPEWEFGGNGDFLGDTHEEFLIRNTDGAVAVGEVVNGVTSFTTIGGLGSEWEFEGIGDFLGNGRDGFLIRNTGDVIGGALYVGEAVNDALTFTDIGGVDPEWEFVGSGDYIGDDSKADFLMRNTGSGALVVGSVNGTTNFTEVSSVGPEWNFHSANVALLPRPA